jgi:hypothetical protein
LSRDDSDLSLITKALREIYPHGHPSYIDNALAKIKLHSTKNRDYALGGDPFGNFIRVSRFVSQYPGLSLGNPTIIALIYMLKQVDAVLWALSQGHTQSESIRDRWADVVVYAGIIEILLNERTR